MQCGMWAKESSFASPCPNETELFEPCIVDRLIIYLLHRVKLINFFTMEYEIVDEWNWKHNERVWGCLVVSPSAMQMSKSLTACSLRFGWNSWRKCHSCFVHVYFPLARRQCHNYSFLQMDRVTATRLSWPMSSQLSDEAEWRCGMEASSCCQLCALLVIIALLTDDNDRSQMLPK